MQKVYLLLRNNKQQGPYTLQEIRELGVLPTDLIWVEGKSAAWRYPSEINELQTGNAHPAQPDEEPASANTTKVEVAMPAKDGNKRLKKVFVSLPTGAQKTAPKVELSPGDALEQKAEALRQKLQAYSPQKENKEYLKPVEPERNHTLKEVENDRLKWLQPQKKKERPFTKRKLSYALLASALALSAVVYFTPQGGNKTQPAVLTTGGTEAANDFSNIDSNAVPTVTIQPDEGMVSESENTISNKKPAGNNVQAPIAQHTVSRTNTPQKDAIEYKPITPEEESKNEELMEEAEDAVPQKENKKTIGQAIGGFFGKFKSKKEEPEQSETVRQEKSDERKATKREDAAPAAPSAEELAAQVKISASEPSENWMLGVKGVKLTLQNQSNYKLAKAVVEMSYFDEQNTLLEKKNVAFYNVPANKSVTQAAPDHRLASYTRYQLIGISSN